MILRCTFWGAPLIPQGEELVRSSCSRNFPRLCRVWRFVEPYNYADSFGCQWHRVFRKLAKRVGLPDTVLDRKKQGFALPLVHWMRNELREMVLGTSWTRALFSAAT